MKPAAILFDLDDTLYEYAPCNEAALRAVQRQASGATGLDWSEFRALHDEVRRELALRLAGTAASHDRALFFEEIARRAAPRVAVESAASWYRLYWDEFLACMRSAPGAYDVLELLARDCRLALVSNHMATPQLAKLAQLGLDSFFSAVVTSEQVGVEKPDARVFRAALDQLGVPASRALMVGDDPVADMAGAHDAGLRTVQSVQFRPRTARAEAADELIEELALLPQLLSH